MPLCVMGRVDSGPPTPFDCQWEGYCVTITVTTFEMSNSGELLL
jgi:hypothetical protein